MSATPSTVTTIPRMAAAAVAAGPRTPPPSPHSSPVRAPNTVTTIVRSGGAIGPRRSTSAAGAGAGAGAGAVDRPEWVNGYVDTNFTVVQNTSETLHQKKKNIAPIANFLSKNNFDFLKFNLMCGVPKNLDNKSGSKVLNTTPTTSPDAAKAANIIVQDGKIVSCERAVFLPPMHGTGYVLWHASIQPIHALKTVAVSPAAASKTSGGGGSGGANKRGNNKKLKKSKSKVKSTLQEKLEYVELPTQGYIRITPETAQIPLRITLKFKRNDNDTAAAATGASFDVQSGSQLYAAAQPRTVGAAAAAAAGFAEAPIRTDYIWHKKVEGRDPVAKTDAFTLDTGSVLSNGERVSNFTAPAEGAAIRNRPIEYFNFIARGRNAESATGAAACGGARASTKAVKSEQKRAVAWSPPAAASAATATPPRPRRSGTENKKYTEKEDSETDTESDADCDAECDAGSDSDDSEESDTESDSKRNPKRRRITPAASGSPVSGNGKIKPQFTVAPAAAAAAVNAAAAAAAAVQQSTVDVKQAETARVVANAAAAAVAEAVAVAPDFVAPIVSALMHVETESALVSVAAPESPLRSHAADAFAGVRLDDAIATGADAADHFWFSAINNAASTVSSVDREREMAFDWKKPAPVQPYMTEADADAVAFGGVNFVSITTATGLGGSLLF